MADDGGSQQVAKPKERERKRAVVRKERMRGCLI